MDLQLGSPPLKFDFDDDGMVGDIRCTGHALLPCRTRGGLYWTKPFLSYGDSNGDLTVDLLDFAVFQQVFTED